MKRISGLLCLLALAVGSTACTLSTPVDAESEPASAPADTAAGDRAVARGEYLVTVAGCHDCHTPWAVNETGLPQPDMSRLLSGHPEGLVMPDPPTLGEGPWVWVGAGTNTAFAGPWGVSYAINLTPDPSGLGAWDEAMFVAAMRTGLHWGQSRPILPPMPWANVAKMTDEDLRAVFAYLQSIPPISNHVPDAVIAEPPSAPAAR